MMAFTAALIYELSKCRSHLSGGGGLLLGEALVIQRTHALLIQALQLRGIDGHLHIRRATRPAHSITAIMSRMSPQADTLQISVTCTACNAVPAVCRGI